jgi:hypothetical protein
MKFCELFGNYFSPSLRKSKNTVKTALGDEKSIFCIGFLFGKDRKTVARFCSAYKHFTNAIISTDSQIEGARSCFSKKNQTRE